MTEDVAVPDTLAGLLGAGAGVAALTACSQVNWSPKWRRTRVSKVDYPAAPSRPM
jgi:hypothetical protein